MKNFLMLLTFTALLAGCSTVGRLGDYVNANPLAADLVVRQSVYRYIEAGDSHAEQVQRAADVKIVMGRVQDYVQGNPVASVDEIMNVIDRSIAWDQLSFSDRQLVQQIMIIVKFRLEEKAADQEIDAEMVLAIRALLQTAVSAASLFL